MTAPGPEASRSSLPGHRSATVLLLVLPTALLLVVSGWLGLCVVLGPNALGLASVMPLGVPGGSGISALVAALSAVILAVGLARRKAWLAAPTVAVFTAGALVQGELLGHAVGASLDVLGLVAVLVAWRSLEAGTGRWGLTAAAALAVLGALAVVATLPDGAAERLRTAVDPLLLWLSLAGAAVSPTAAAQPSLLLAALALMVACACLLQAMPDGRSVPELERALAVLRRRGAGSLLPYQLQAPAVAVASEDGSTALAYARAGRTAVVLGDPAGEPLEASRTFDSWVEGASRSDWAPVVYQASEAFRDRLVERGWHGVLVGMEAVIDPTAFRLGTPRLANVRHTVTRSRKGGVSVAWSAHGLPESPHPAGLAAGLADIDATWRRAAGPQMGFTVGQYDGAHLGDAGVAAATDADGNAVAFVVLRPTGADGSWALDLMRRLPGSVPGAVEACLVAAIEGLGTLGVRQLSLGLAPLHGLDPAEGSGPQRLLARSAMALRPFYDYPGLAFYKTKFDPQWLPRYLVVRDRGDLVPASVSLLRLHLGGSWARVLRSLLAGSKPGAGS